MIDCMENRQPAKNHDPRNPADRCHLSFFWLAAPASAQSCGPASGLDFVCGPKNAEDLVRVPGTPWIIASGMSAGASLTLIDSRNGTYSGLQCASEARCGFRQLRDAAGFQ